MTKADLMSEVLASQEARGNAIKAMPVFTTTGGRAHDRTARSFSFLSTAVASTPDGAACSTAFALTVRGGDGPSAFVNAQ